VFHESPWTAWKFIRALEERRCCTTDHNERSGPTIFRKRHSKEPFCKDVGLVFLWLGLGRGLVVVVTAWSSW